MTKTLIASEASDVEPMKQFKTQPFASREAPRMEAPRMEAPRGEAPREQSRDESLRWARVAPFLSGQSGSDSFSSRFSRSVLRPIFFFSGDIAIESVQKRERIPCKFLRRLIFPSV